MKKEELGFDVTKNSFLMQINIDFVKKYNLIIPKRLLFMSKEAYERRIWNQINDLRELHVDNEGKIRVASDMLYEYMEYVKFLGDTAENIAIPSVLSIDSSRSIQSLLKEARKHKAVVDDTYDKVFSLRSSAEEKVIEKIVKSALTNRPENTIVVLESEYVARKFTRNNFENAISDMANCRSSKSVGISKVAWLESIAFIPENEDLSRLFKRFKPTSPMSVKCRYIPIIAA